MLDPQDAVGIESPVVGFYSRAEDYLIRLISRAIERTGDAPDWAETQLLRVRQERANILGVVAVMDERAPGLVESAVDRAYVRGYMAADAELGALADGALESLVGVQTVGSQTAINTHAVAAIAAPTARTLVSAHHRILRNTDDVFRQVVQKASGMVVAGAMTPQQAMSRAFTDMAREGLGLFRDERGRKWGLDTYAEMATRTATNQALRAGHADSMAEHGVDLVVVSSHPNPAPQCAPYERKVLSLRGEYPAGSHLVGGRRVTVKATMSEAEARGLHHPHCRHTHSAYIPGYTNTTPPTPDEGHEGYKATQKQRYLERQVRSWKRAEQAAVMDVDKKRATAKAREYQARIRDHVAEHDLPRRRHREQLRRPITD